MKKYIWAATVIATTLGISNAQTWTTDVGQYRLNACYGTKDGIQCDLTYILGKKQTIDLDVDYGDFSAFTSDGTKASPKISIAGKDWGSYPSSVQVYNGTPVKVSLLFNIPANTPSLASLAIGDENIKNIPVRPLGSPANASVVTPVQNSQAINLVGNWNATLSNCRQTASGIFTCNATLKK